VLELETVTENMFPFDPKQVVDFGTVTLKNLDVEVPVKFCEHTNVAFISKRPLKSAYDVMYASTFYEESSDLFEGDSFKKKVNRRLSYVIELLEKSKIQLRPDADILDFGCGRGRFLSELIKAVGGNGFGIEPSKLAADHARKAGVEIIGSTLADLDASGKKFDAIVMIHVLEHLLEPRKQLEELLRFLKPAGILIIQVPDLDASKSISLAHVFNYSARALSILCQSLELQVLGVNSTENNLRSMKNLSIVATKAVRADAVTPRMPPAKTKRELLSQHKRYLEIRRDRRLMPRILRKLGRFIGIAKKNSD